MKTIPSVELGVIERKNEDSMEMHWKSSVFRNRQNKTRCFVNSLLVQLTSGCDFKRAFSLEISTLSSNLEAFRNRGPCSADLVFNLWNHKATCQIHPIMLTNTVTDLPALVVCLAQPSRLFHKTANNGVQSRNKSLISTFERVMIFHRILMFYSFYSFIFRWTFLLGYLVLQWVYKLVL